MRLTPVRLIEMRLRTLLVAFFLPLALVSCNSSDQTTSSVDTASPLVLSSAPIGGEKFPPHSEAPNFTLKDLEGRPVSLKDFKGKGLLINFWATWCVPCVAEMPALEKLYQELKGDGIIVVGINFDPPENAAGVKEFIRDKGITFPILLADSIELANAWGVSGFPESFLVDREGKFALVLDPEKRLPSMRLLADRPWDSAEYVKLIRDALK